MGKFKLASLALAVALGVSGAARASTVLTGVVPGNGHLFGGLVLTTSFDGTAFGFDWTDQVGHVDLGPGTYRFEFTADVDVGDLKVTEAVNDNRETLGSDPADFPTLVANPTIRDLTAPEGEQFGDSPYFAGQVIRGSIFVPRARTFVDASDPLDTLVTTETFSGIVAVEGFTDEGDGPDGHWTLTITSVPEPSTWALALIGLGGVGASLRRRRAIAV